VRVNPSATEPYEGAVAITRPNVHGNANAARLWSRRVYAKPLKAKRFASLRGDLEIAISTGYNKLASTRSADAQPANFSITGSRWLCVLRVCRSCPQAFATSPIGQLETQDRLSGK